MESWAHTGTMQQAKAEGAIGGSGTVGEEAEGAAGGPQGRRKSSK